MKIIILLSCALSMVRGSSNAWNQHGNSIGYNSGGPSGHISNEWNAQQNAGWNANPWNAGTQRPINPEHVPVIEDGVPVETPEVQAAKAEHFALFAQARDLAERHRVDYRESSHYDNDGNYYRQEQSRIPYNQPDYTTAARFNNAIHRPSQYANQYHSGVGPVETAEVQEAKAAHLQAHANALARATAADQAHQHYRLKRSVYLGYGQSHYTGPQHIPIIKKDGVPLDTIEVQHARAQHLEAVLTAKAHNPWPVDRDDGKWKGEEVNGGWNNGYQGGHHNVPRANVAYNINHDYYAQKYHGPQHIPIIDKSGVPVDTLEVQVARHQHLTAAALAKSSQGPWLNGVQNLGWSKSHQEIQPVLTVHGVPQDTPAVQIAKIQHFQAHAQQQLNSLGHNEEHWD